MNKVYRSARGDMVNIDALRLNNENVIAIGNMKTNGRGDELGRGGKVAKSKSQVMQEYHKLNTPVVTEELPEEKKSVAPVEERKPIHPQTKDISLIEEPQTEGKPRGKFADAVAKEKEINQELLQPKKVNSSVGVKRI